MIFSGIHRMKIDKKGRVSIPASFRDKNGFNDYSIFKPSSSPVLVGYKSESIKNPEVLSLMAIFTSSVNVDDNGRIVIGKDSINHLGIDVSTENCKLLFIGTAGNFHIMSECTWDSMKHIYEERLRKLIATNQLPWCP